MPLVIGHSPLRNRAGSLFFISISQKFFVPLHSQLTIRNWHLGERIAREELGGAQRAEYGERVMAQLADDLTARYGKGFDKSSLHAYVKFSRLFPEIVDAVPPQFAIVDAVSPQLLPWTHYRELIRVEDATARVWYEQEAMQEMWSTRTLHRNILLRDHSRKQHAGKKGTIPDAECNRHHVIHFLLK